VPHNNTMIGLASSMTFGILEEKKKGRGGGGGGAPVGPLSD
jgi:hypothetical protein